jgi:predicted O-methyltransferase YrrM
MSWKRFIKNLRDRFFAGLAHQSDLDRLYGLIEGLQQVQNAMDGKPVLKPLRGWAISPDAMARILAELQERDSPTVVEFGGGQSTIIMASVLKRMGGTLWSVDHDAEYAAGIEKQVIACGLSDVVRFIHAPLCAVVEGQEAFRSYDLSKIPDLAPDVALIDGPPYMNGELTRFTPLHWAVKRLAKGGVAFLDDAARGAEKRCVALVLSRCPGSTISDFQAEKGLVALRHR